MPSLFHKNVKFIKPNQMVDCMEERLGRIEINF